MSQSHPDRSASTSKKSPSGIGSSSMDGRKERRPAGNTPRRPGRRHEIDVDDFRDQCNLLFSKEQNPQVRAGIRCAVDLLLDLAFERHGYFRLSAGSIPRLLCNGDYEEKERPRPEAARRGSTRKPDP